MGLIMLRGAFVSIGILVSALLAGPSHAQSNPSSSGTGFFVNVDGWAVTNAHVLEGCTRASVPTMGDATDWIIDRQNDLAAVKVAGGAGKPFLRLRATTPRLGDDIAAFGYPLHGVLSDSIKVTTGNINSLVGIDNDTRYLQISTPLQPGNSGGPVVDRSGSALGVATAVLGSRFAENTGILPQNVNFAVRSDVLELFLQSREIEYESLPASGELLSTADLADTVAPAVVQILCFGRPNGTEAQTASRPVPTTPSAIPKPHGRQFQRVDNYDVIGFDYQAVRSVSQLQCQQACEADSSCRATTYNKKERFCFLKNDAALLVANSDALAHVADEIAGRVMVSTFTIAAGKDMAGGDYKRIRNSNFIGCYAECELDSQCRAFAFVRQYSDCWLKDRLGAVSTKAGVDLGVK